MQTAPHPARPVRDRPVAHTITRADAAAALDVTVDLVDAYVRWGLLVVPAPDTTRVTIASVGALAARRRSLGRDVTALVAEPGPERRPHRHTVVVRSRERLAAG